MRYPAWKRLFALLLCFCFMLFQLPLAVAAEESGQSGFLIEAGGPDITVSAPNSVDLFTDSAENGVTATIARDFSQTVRVNLRNRTSSPVTYYMAVDNPNQDLSMNFVGSAYSQETAVSIPAWGSATAELAIFAQDAQSSQYDNITLTCHTIDGGAVDRTLHLTVTGESMTLEFSHTENEIGVLYFTVTNVGNDVNSLIIDVDDALAPYAYFPKVLNQFTLKSGDSETFSIVPMFPDGSLESVTGKVVAQGNGTKQEYEVTLKYVDTVTVSGNQLTEEALFANSDLPGYLLPENAAPMVEAEAGGLTMSYNMVNGDTTLPVKITFTRTAEACPEDSGDVLDDDDAIWHGTQISEAKIEGDKLLITMKRWTSAASLLEEADPVTGVLNQFDIEIDISQLPDDKREQLISDYSKSVEHIEKGEEYIADQYPGMSDRRKAERIAYVQLSILIDLLNEKDEDGNYKYPEAREQFAEELAKMGYDQEDPIADLENTLDHDSIVQEAKEKVIDKKVIMDDENKDKDTDQKKDEIEEDKKNNGSVITIDEEINQCTNRGSITSSFHGTDYVGNRSRAVGVTAADKGVRVFYTGRIVSEDKYINFEPIKYDLILNGQPMNESNNSGLSELNIIELDADKVLLGQKNTFTRDYDVNPGTHFVTAENRYTLIYPADAQLKVTDASIVQPAVPDFDIYKKNIFVIDADGNYVNEPIAGANTLHVSVSNRGARSGFFQLSIKDASGKTLVDDAADDVYRFLPAFTSETLELDDVHLDAGTNNITVTMTDCSPYIAAKEASVEAEGTIEARSREIPAILSTTPSNGDDLMRVSTLGASLSNFRDVEKVDFYLDGAAEPVGTKEGAVSSYSVVLPTGLEAGAHTIRVVVSYYNGGPGDTSTVTTETTANFTVTPPAEPEYNEWAEVVLPEAASQPIQYQLLRYNESQKRYENPFGSQGYQYTVTYADGKASLRLRDSGESTIDPEGTILVAYDSTNGKLYAGDVGAQGTAVTLAAGRTLTLQNASFQSYVSVSIPYTGNSYRLTVAQGQNTIALPALLLQVSASLQYSGASGVWLSLYEEMDFREENQICDAAASVRTYTFTVPDNAGPLNAQYLYSTSSDSSYYSSSSMTTRTEGTTLTAYLTRVQPNAISEYIQLASDNSSSGKQPYLLYVNAADYTEGMDLGALPMKKLSFTADNPEKLDVYNVRLSHTGMNRGYSIAMYDTSGTILCTPGNYTAYISFDYDGINHYVTKTIDLTSADQELDLYDEPPMGTVTVTWPETLGETASVSLDGSNDSISTDVKNGAAQTIPAATYRYAYITIYPDAEEYNNYYQFEVSAPLTVAEGANAEITIGDTITGDLKLLNSTDPGAIYTVNSNIQMRLENLRDQFGNSLNNLRNLTGYVVFTSKSGEEGDAGSFAVPVTLDNLYSGFSVLLARAGSYTTKFTTDPKAAELSAAVITATAGDGGSISPSGKVLVAFGGNQAFRITASSGYQISDVLVDGSSVGIVSEYIFEDVAGSHTIEAIFTALTPEDPKPIEDDKDSDSDTDGDEITVPERYERRKSKTNTDTSTTNTTKPTETVQPSRTGKNTDLTITPNVSDDGIASYEMGKKEADDLADSAKQNNSERVNLNVRADKPFSQFDLTIPAKEAQQLATQSGAELNLLTPIGNLVLSNTALGTLANQCSDVLGMAIQKTADGVTIAVRADGRDTNTLSGVMASIPLDALSGNGVVAFRVNADGSETLLKKSYVDGSSLQVRLDGSATVHIRDNSQAFADTAGHWAKGAIDFVSSRELFQGTNASNFSPDLPMTRAMLVAVLHRLEDTPTGSAASFSDVGSGEWYAAAVAWASSTGIVSGSGGKFLPDSNITREQLAVILYQYARQIGMDTSARADLSRFPDAGQVSSWAAEAMQWAVSTGMISGTSQGMLNPGGNASRSEVASMLMRLVQQIV